MALLSVEIRGARAGAGTEIRRAGAGAGAIVSRNDGQLGRVC